MRLFSRGFPCLCKICSKHLWIYSYRFTSYFTKGQNKNALLQTRYSFLNVIYNNTNFFLTTYLFSGITCYWYSMDQKFEKPKKYNDLSLLFLICFSCFTFWWENCKCEMHVSKSIVVEVEKQLKSLERSQSFDETQKWYDAGEFDKVVDCLLKTSLNKVKHC